MPDGLATDLHHVGVSPRVLAREGVQQLTLAIARHTGNAHHLAGPHLEAQAFQVDPKG